MQKELLEPAIEGTINVITAAEEAGIERVVVTSSSAAIIPSPCWPADVPKSEACWTDEDYCRSKGVTYLCFITFYFHVGQVPIIE